LKECYLKQKYNYIIFLAFFFVWYNMNYISGNNLGLATIPTAVFV